MEIYLIFGGLMIRIILSPIKNISLKILNKEENYGKY